MKGWEEISVEIPCDKPKRKFYKSHRKFQKQEIYKQKAKEKKELESIDAAHFVTPPGFSGKNAYLYYVEAKDCVKDKVKWKQGFQLVQQMMGKQNKKAKKKPKSCQKSKSKHSKTISISSANDQGWKKSHARRAQTNAEDCLVYS